MQENIFRERYNSLIANIHCTKYYHLKSINNYTTHFGEFRTMYYKDRVQTILNDYFDYTSEKGALSRDEGIYIYQNFVKPLGKIYAQNLKFSIYIDPVSIIFFLVAWFIGLFLVKSSMSAYLISLFLAVIIYIPSYLKKRSKRVYGFDY
ncbi:MAG TPA: hypothetical protein PK841_07905 [Chitinophagaceae bacterium]|nr:hypothetical protein [Chitinophagaceae bacterium]